MQQTGLDKAVRDVSMRGFSIPVPIFIFLLSFCALVILRFQRSTLLSFVVLIAIGGAVLVVPATIIYIGLIRRIRGMLARLPEPDASLAGSESFNREILAVEIYPIVMAAGFFLCGLASIILVGLIPFYFFMDINGWLCLLYVLWGAVASVTCAYIEYYVFYLAVRPMRIYLYERVDFKKGQAGMKMWQRIMALGLLLSLIPLVLGWVAATSITLFDARDNTIGRAEENAAYIGTLLEESVAMGDLEIPEGLAGGNALTGTETLLLVDATGEVVYRLDPGGGVDPEQIPDLLACVLEKGEGAANDRIDLIAAPDPVGDTGYTLVVMMPLGPFLGSIPVTFILFLVIGLMLFVLAASLTWMSARNISEPLSDLEGAAAEVSGGDLTVQLVISSSDETGKVTRNFSEMVRSLHDISSESRSAAERTSEGATEVSATTEEVQASVAQLTTIIQQVAQNAETEVATANNIYMLTSEVIKALEISSGHADQGVEASRNSSELAEFGRMDALAAVEKMGSVKESIGETAEIIGTLDGQISEIGVIIEVINNIADQTNLLALNAAIEAARAQEHGRGFAVVADEVKKLAEESARSASRIASLVREIQSNTSTAVQATRRGTEEVEFGVEAVHVAGDSLDKIFEYVKRAEELSTTVAGTIREHLELVTHTMESMEDIRGIAEQNAASTQEISAAAEEQAASMQELASTSQELASLADNLRQMADRYRL